MLPLFIDLCQNIAVYIKLTCYLNKRLIKFALSKLNKRLIKMEESKIQDKRDDILDVAERLFAEQGFEAVSVREISKAADINIAMVSYYFGSKEKLYEEVINRKLTPTAMILQQANMQTTNKEKLFAIVDLFITRFFDNRQFQNLIFREMALSQRKEMPEFITQRMHQNFSIISDIINKGIKAKEFKKVDVELTVMSIIGIIKTYTASGTMACKILQTENESEVFNAKHKTRFKKYLRELLTSHLDIK